MSNVLISVDLSILINITGSKLGFKKIAKEYEVSLLVRQNIFHIKCQSVRFYIFKKYYFFPATAPFTTVIFIHDDDDDSTLSSWKPLWFWGPKTQPQSPGISQCIEYQREKSASMFLIQAFNTNWFSKVRKFFQSVTSFWSHSQEIQLRTKTWVGDKVDGCIYFKRIIEVDMSSQQMDVGAKFSLV